MPYRRHYRRSIMPRRKPRWQWVRETVNNASPNATLNTIDLLSNWRTHAGITVNLPEITIWRIHLKITITISSAAALAANDGVLITSFVDGMNATILNQVSNSYDQPDLIYSMLFAGESAMLTGSVGAQTELVLYKEFDVRSHRKLQSIDDTLFLQLASSGQSMITGYSYSASILQRYS